MSETVDSKVVEMQFDNRQFERNVGTSLSTLERLKKGLDFTGATKSLDGLSRATENVNMNGLAGAVDTVRMRFSAMEVVAMTALSRITNAVMRTGERMLSALTIDPIRTGFSEYETQIGSIQTILANTEHQGTNLQQVNKALDELNLYADKTIYNFTQMTRNIGTFTAAGVDLRTSTDSIKGIANLAAVSGSTSQQASTAMYQLSQALAAGRVSLMDWNSVVNAGMGGKVFQNALIRTSELLKTGANNAIEEYGSFRESLTRGEWLTTEVLTETLKQFAGAYTKEDLIAQGFTEKQATEIAKMATTAEDAATKVKTATQLWDTLKESAQSGWTQSWEIIAGDFEEAKEFFTIISDTVGGIIGKSADARNQLMQGGLSSGWKQLMAEGIDDEETFIDVFTKVADKKNKAFTKILNSKKVDGNFEKALSIALKKGIVSSDTFAKAVENLNKKLKKMTADERKAFGYTNDMTEHLKELNKEIQNGSIDLGEFTDKMVRSSGRENLIESLFNSAKALSSVIKPIKESFRDFFPPMQAETLYKITENLRSFTNGLILNDTQSKQLKRTADGLFSVLDLGRDVIVRLGKLIFPVASHMSDVVDIVLEATAKIGDFLVEISNSATRTKAIDKAFSKIETVVSGVGSELSKFADILTGKVSSGIDTVSKAAETSGLINFFKSLWKFGKSVSGVLSSVLGSIFSNLGNGLMNLNFDWLVNLSKGVSFAAIAKGMLSISDSFSNFGKNFTKIGKTSVKFLDSLKDTLSAYQDTLKAKSIKEIAKAIGILAMSLFLISSINPERLDSSVGAMTLMFGELVGVLAILGSKGMQGARRAAGTVVMMQGVGTAMLMLAGSLKIMSTINTEQLGHALLGFTAVAGVMTGCIVALKVAASKWHRGKIKGLFSFATTMIILSASLKLLATMSWSDIGRGLTAMGGAAVIMGTTMTVLMAASSKWKKKPRGLFVFASSMLELSASFKVFASEDWDGIKRALTAMGAVAAGMVVAIGALSFIGTKTSSFKTAGLSVSLIAMSTAMLSLIPVLKLLAGMPLKDLAKGITAMVISLGALGLAGVLLTPAIPSIAALAKAIALFGVGVFGIGAGLSAMAAGITLIAAAGTAGATAIVASLTIIISGIAGLIPGILVEVGKGIIALAKTIGEGTPVIVESFLTLISGTFSALVEHQESIINSLLTFVIGLINGVATHMPDLIQAVVNLLMSFFAGITDALSGIDTDSLLKGIVGVGLLTGLMYGLSAVSHIIPSAMTGVLGLGAVLAELSLVLAAVGALSKIPGLSGMIQNGGEFLKTIGVAIGQFFGGILGGIADGAVSTLPSIGTYLSEFMVNAQPFMEGIKQLDTNALEGTLTLVDVIKSLTAASLMDAIASWISGGNSFGEFANQLVPLGEGLKGYSDAVAGIDDKAVLSSSKALKNIVEAAKEIPNSGGFVSLFTGDNDVGSFSSGLSKLGEGLSEYHTKTKTINISNLESVISSTYNMIDMFRNMSEVDLAGSAGFTDTLYAVGAAGIDKFTEAFKECDKEVQNATDKLMDVASTSLKSACEDYYEAGKNTAIGFSNGISAFAYLSTNAASNMADAAYEALKVALDIRSPSHKAEWGGSMFDAGFARGVSKHSGEPIAAVNSVANSMMESISKTADMFGALVNDDIVVSPKIRPVVDLDNVRKNAQITRDLFGTSLNSATHISGYVDNVTTSRNQNENVVSAIGKLEDRVKNLPEGRTYNINGITYDSGSEVATAIDELIRLIKVERRT